MSLFDALRIGRSGVTAQSQAIAITSRNVANVNTPGYSRQRPVYEPIHPSTEPGLVASGGGALVTEIERIVDRTLEATLIREKSGLGFDQTIQQGLARLETTVVSLGDRGLGNAVNEFFASLNDLANNPSDLSVRNTVIGNADRLVSQIRDTDFRLTELQRDVDADIVNTVEEINQLTTEIAELNRRIFVAEAGGTGTPTTTLRDDRNLALQQLAEKIEFTFFENDSQISVYMAGGLGLVDGDAAATLIAQPGAASDPTHHDIYHRFDAGTTGPITQNLRGGVLGALVQLRDTVLADQRDELDGFAYTFAQRVNAVHYPQPAPAFPAGAYGLEDGQQRRFFIDGTAAAVAEGADFALVGGAAASIQIHPDLLANARHIAAGAETIDPGPPPPALGAAPGDNRNALALAALGLAPTQFWAIQRDVNGNEIAPAAANGATSTFSGAFDAIAGRLGAALRSANHAAAQSQLIVDELQSRRDAYSGVSLDEEVANLVRFERAYQAAARVMDTADQLMDELLRI